MQEGRNERVREVWKVSACQSSHMIRITAVVDSCGGRIKISLP